MADLLYALGWALWTGVVVVVSVQAVPVLSDQVRAGSDQASEDDGAPTAKWQPD